MPQFVDPERVRQEPHVGDEIGVGRQAVLEAEALQRDAEAGAPGLGERVGDLRRELVDVEVGGVDDDVARLAHLGEACALDADAVEDRAVALQRMRPAHRLEPAHEHVVGGIEEHHAHVHAGAERLDDLGQFGEEVAAADVDDRRDARQ